MKKLALIISALLISGSLQAQTGGPNDPQVGEPASTDTTEMILLSNEPSKKTSITKEPPTEIEAPAVGETICKKGDLKACAKALRGRVGKPEFRASFDQVCLENKNFRCVKITIRGEPNEELKYQASQNPKAHLYPTKEGSEDKIYMLEMKSAKK